MTEEQKAQQLSGWLDVAVGVEQVWTPVRVTAGSWRQPAPMRFTIFTPLVCLDDHILPEQDVCRPSTHGNIALHCMSASVSVFEHNGIASTYVCTYSGCIVAHSLPRFGQRPR